MKKIALLTSSLLLSLYASDDTWTNETKAMSQEDSNKIITSYTEGKESPLNLTFKDDKPSKEELGIEENIMVIGASLSYSATSETLENTKGEKVEDYSTSSFRILIGKDLTLWHEQYTQPTRIFFDIAYNYLSSDLTSLHYTVGLRENMEYWPLYSTPKYTIFPTFSYALGNSTLKRQNQTIRGFSSEASGGLTYKRGNFEYFANLIYTSVTWDYPIEGIIDNSSSLGLNFGLNYKLMYGDF